MMNADLEPDGYINFNDFLIATIDLSKDKVLKYCEKAFSTFFSKKKEIDIKEFEDILSR